MPTTIKYEITPFPNRQEYLVQMHIDHAKKGQEICMPVWTPGSYARVNHSINILEIKARADGNEVNLEQSEASKWKLPDQANNLQIDYKINANKLSTHGVFLDREIGFFDGSAVFLQVLDIDANYVVKINKPEGDDFQKWLCTTAMSPVHKDLHQFGQFTTENYLGV